MRSDRLRRRFEAGEVAYGLVTTWPDPDLVEASAACGFDYVFIDAEHGALDIRTCAELVRAADCGEITSIIRVPYGDVRGIYAYLDLGAGGLIVPHIKSAADAAVALGAGYYPPVGVRGAFSSSRAARYGTASSADAYYRAANEAVWIFPLIEDVEAVDAIDQIVALPAVRGVFIGPGDLGLSRISSGRAEGPTVDALLNRVVAAGLRAGKVVGTVAGTPAAASALVAKGVQMICAGAGALFTAACRGYLDAVPRKRA